jgi:hypothetical protein
MTLYKVLSMESKAQLFCGSLPAVRETASKLQRLQALSEDESVATFVQSCTTGPTTQERTKLSATLRNIGALEQAAETQTHQIDALLSAACHLRHAAI